MTRGARCEARGASRCGARAASRCGARAASAGAERKAEIAAKLLSMAARSTRATVGRIMRCRRRPSGNAARASHLAARVSRRALRQVLEPRVLLDERELGGADRAVALFADDDLGHPFGILVRLAVGVAVLIFTKDEHHEG